MSLLLCALFSLIFMLPAFFLLRRSGGGLLEYAYHRSPAAGWALSALLGLLSLFGAALCATQYGFFITGAIYPQERGWIFILLFTLCALYMAALGLEAVARLSGPVLALLLLSLLCIVLSLMGDFDPLGMAPPDPTALPAMLGRGYSSFSSTGELMLLLILLPCLKGNVKKGFLWWLAGITALTGAVIATALYTIQDYAATQAYPFYAIAKTALLFGFQRMDALHLVVWTMIGLLKLSLYLIAFAQCFRTFCSPKLQKGLLPAAAAAVILLGLSLSYFWRLFSAAYRLLLSGIPLLCCLLSPVLLRLLPKGRKGGAAVEK